MVNLVNKALIHPQKRMQQKIVSRSIFVDEFVSQKQHCQYRKYNLSFCKTFVKLEPDKVQYEI